MAIFASVALGSSAFLLLDRAVRGSLLANLPFWGSLALGGVIIFLLGLWDDVKGVGIWGKFAVQFLAAGLVMSLGGVIIESFTHPVSGRIQLGWVGILITALWIVGVTNAFNLIDGLDGLAGGVALISTMGVWLTGWLTGQRLLLTMVTACLAGCLLGFLRFNFHPAKIFLGDCGSMFIGFNLAVLSVQGCAKRTTVIALMIPILIVGIPVFDTLYSMGRRLGKRIVVERDWRPSSFVAMFRADRKHLHHTLMEMGFSHRKTVVIVYGLSILMALLAVWALILQSDRVSLGLVCFGLVAYIMIKQFGKAMPIRTGRLEQKDEKNLTRPIGPQ